MISRFQFLLLFILLPLLPSSAQKVDLGTLWMDKPGFPAVFSGYEKENVVGILDEERYNYYYDDQENNLFLTHFIHRRVRLNTDDAINGFNKLSVSLSGVIEVVDIKARVIKPDGRVIEFDRNNIREIRDEESQDNFKIFAIDGIEKGDDIEYLIVRKMSGSNFGRAYFQYDYPIQKAYFELISPKNLKYAAKGYNGFPDPVAEVLPDERNKISCELDSIPALKDERYDFYNPRRARLEYKLDYNLARGKGKVLTWNDASQRIYEIMYQGVNQKSIEKWISTLRENWMSNQMINKGEPFSIPARVEEYIKTNIHVEDFDAPEFSDLDFIRTRKVTGEQGIVRLYANIFRTLGVRHEIVLTSERDQIRFDPDFQSWNYLGKYLIYLPEDDKYIDPATNTFRIGCIPGELSATYGLFVELVKIGEFESATGRIKFIKPAPFDANYDNMHIEIFVDIEKAETRIVDTRGLKGLSGGYIERIYKTLDEERKQDLLKSIMESKATNPNYSSLRVLEDSDIDLIKDAEFIIYGDFIASTLLEIAGNKMLVNIGESIGEQVELYQDQTKRRGGESDFNRRYCRRIVLHVPEGYRIVNPDAGDMNIIEKAGDEPLYAFISTHEYSGNTFIINIDEYYKEIFISPERFEGFRSVVNAAANFNKVVLVLEKI